MRRWCSLDLLAVVHLGHPANSSTSKSWVLVAVSPTVDCSLNQASFASQRRVKLRQSPTDAVAVSLIHQTVSTILVLRAAGSWVNAILLLELGRQLIGIDRFNVASNGVLHLNSIAGVLESNPLNTIAVLSHNQWSSRGNGTWCGIRVNTRRGVSWALQLWCIGLMLSLWHG